MSTEVKTDITETLEALIDRHGLVHVVTGLQIVCDEKSAHIEANWQDKRLAREWHRASSAIYSMAHKIARLAI